MNNLQQVMKEAREGLEVLKRKAGTEREVELSYFFSKSLHWVPSLLSGLEEAQREIERLKKMNNDMWECPDCGFGFDACHVDVDEKGKETGECTCPLCAEEELTKENSRLRTEHAAMKEALEWYASSDVHATKESFEVTNEVIEITHYEDDRGKKAQSILSTLSPKEEQTEQEQFEVCESCGGTGEIWWQDGDDMKGGRCPYCNRVEEAQDAPTE